MKLGFICKEFVSNASGFKNALDMIFSFVIFGASPANYKMFEFEKLTLSQRSTYVTNRTSRRLIKKYNDPEYIDVFEDKVKFAQCFSELFARKYIETNGLTYKKFCEFRCKHFICKPVNGAQGNSIIVFDEQDDLGEEKIQKLAEQYPNCILEEWIPQHEEISKLYPNAVNCLRLITIHKNGNTHILTGGLTLGVDGLIANGSRRSIICPVDIESGILHKAGGDSNKMSYDFHPVTNATIVGVQILYWKEIIQMLNIAAARVPQVGYVGWDIAITPTGPILIEGNTTPGYKYYQLPQHLTDGIGNLPVYKEFL